MLNPAGHTVAGNQRRSLRSRLQGMPQGGMARLLWAMGAMGHTGDAGQAGSEREIQRALQWLFWMLAVIAYGCVAVAIRSEEHTSELQSLMRISYAVFCLKKKNNIHVTDKH